MKRLFLAVLFLSCISALCCTAIQIGGTAAPTKEIKSVQLGVEVANAKLDKIMVGAKITPLTPAEIAGLQAKVAAGKLEKKSLADRLHSMKFWIIALLIGSAILGIALEYIQLETPIPAFDIAIKSLGIAYHIAKGFAHAAWHFLVWIVPPIWAAIVAIAKRVFKGKAAAGKPKA